MDKLEKLRQDRKKLEQLETKVLSAVEDPVALHAWAARELKQLSDSIRSSSLESQDIELKTARTRIDIPIRVQVPEERSEVVIETAKISSSEQLEPEPGPELDIEDSLEELPVASSEKIIASSVVCEDSEIIPATARVIPPQPSPELTLSSLTPSVSVSLQDEFCESIRSSSPEPLTERRVLNINEIVPPIKKRSEGNRSPRTVLEAFAARLEKEKERKRNQLGAFAKSLFDDKNGDGRLIDQENLNQTGNQAIKLESQDTRAPLRSALPEEDGLGSPPPLIEKKTKSGIAFSIDLASFNSR
jgi:hypothetical protein